MRVEWCKLFIHKTFSFYKCSYVYQERKSNKADQNEYENDFILTMSFFVQSEHIKNKGTRKIEALMSLVNILLKMDKIRQK